MKDKIERFVFNVLFSSIFQKEAVAKGHLSHVTNTVVVTFHYVVSCFTGREVNIDLSIILSPIYTD